MKPIAIIPARGGSKRLPRKNILPLGGVPLIARVISTCLRSGVFGCVVVSTEDDEIAQIALDAGATIRKRPVGLAQDRSTVVQVCLDVLDHFSCDSFCCVYATAALLSENTLRDSFELLDLDQKTDVVMGVSCFNYSPVQALVVDECGYARMLLPEYRGIQSQFHPKFRVSNGSLYWARKDAFLREQTFYVPRLRVFDVPLNEVCDIDTPVDYENLRQKFGEK